MNTVFKTARVCNRESTSIIVQANNFDFKHDVRLFSVQRFPHVWIQCDLPRNCRMRSTILGDSRNTEQKATRRLNKKLHMSTSDEDFT